MDPQNNQNNGQVGVPNSNRDVYNQTNPPTDGRLASQEAAANLIRGQIENIYQGNSNENTPHTTPVEQPTTGPSTPTNPAPADTNTVAANQSPTSQPTTSHGLQTTPPKYPKADQSIDKNSGNSTYRRTMGVAKPNRSQSSATGQWQQYHDAWQKYYQLYYQRYYLSNMYANQSKTTEGQAQPKTISGGSLSQAEAMKELRQNIRQKVSSSAEKVTKSRHFVPVIAGIVVMMIFLFLQYNRAIFGAIAAYTTPGNIEPQNIIASPTTDIKVGPEPKMIIPKINIDAPVVYGIGPDYNSQMAAMEKGIAHFSIPGANAVPGQIGNAVFAGHSSNDVFAQGDYKFIFAQNEKLTKGDIIYMHYQGKRYTYSVTETEVVMPEEVSKVQVKVTKPTLTLVSCVPLGTAKKRLLVFAEQISPNPDGASEAVDNKTAPSTETIPGKPAPTLIEKLFGAN